MKYADKSGQGDRQDYSWVLTIPIVIFADTAALPFLRTAGVEYGVHVPFIAGGSVDGKPLKQRGLTDELMDFTDVLPTLVEFAGGEIPSHYNVDGKSMAPFLTGKSETTKPVIYSFPAVSTLIRTKEFMLEAVSPLYGKERGRFYKTNGSYDGRGYENITHNPEYAEVRKQFDQYLAQMPNPLPTSWEDPVWDADKFMKRSKKFWSNKKQSKKHHELPKEYQFYDPAH